MSAVKRTFKKEMVFKCSECPKVFAYESYLRQHAVVHDPERKRDFICTECGRSFTNKGPLEMHRKTHNRDVSSQPAKRIRLESGSVDSGIFSEESRYSEKSGSIVPDSQEEGYQVVIHQDETSGAANESTSSCHNPVSDLQPDNTKNQETVDDAASVLAYFEREFDRINFMNKWHSGGIGIDNLMYPIADSCQISCDSYGSYTFNSDNLWSEHVDSTAKVFDYCGAGSNQMHHDRWERKEYIDNDIVNILNGDIEKDISTVALHFNV